MLFQQNFILLFVHLIFVAFHLFLLLSTIFPLFLIYSLFFSTLPFFCLPFNYQIYQPQFVHMQPRRYITAQRSAQKQVHRPSYEPLTLSTHSQTNIQPDIPRYGSAAHLMVPTSSRVKYGEVPRSPSATQFKSRQQHLKSNIARRKNDGVVTNLKNQLQNLKLQVSKIMNKDGENSRTYSSKDSGVHSAYDEYQPGDNLILGNYGKDISDSVSVTSEKVIDEPLRKLQLELGSENYDHSHYLELQNNLLKTQLRNLKNKYNATKQELKQKCEALQKKNEYLQISLRRSEDSLRECRRNLQIEIQTIKFQLSRRMQQQIEQQQLKTQKMTYPERDISGGNQLMQDKLKKIYEQLNQKSRTINNMNLQFNDLRGEVERKSFQLKKEVERCGQLTKQLEFAKRQNSRNQNLLEQQVSKKMQLVKNVEYLRQKISQLSKQLQLKDQIVNNSENFQNKLSTQLQNYKQNQQKLLNQNYEHQNQVRKLRQLNSTNEQQIKQLKSTINDFTIQIEQLLKNNRMEKQKNMEIQQSYRAMIDEIKDNHQRELEDVQGQFQKFRHLSTETHFQKEEEMKERVDTDIKEKDKQISKWKAEYKMLKIKFQQYAALENSKKEEIQSYYRNYKEYKTKNKVLEMRNKVMEESANQYIDKIQKIEAANLQERAQYIETINNLNMHCQQLARRSQSLQLQLNELRQAIGNQVQRANQQESYRRQIEQKVLNLDVQGNDGLEQVIDKIKKRVNDQDQKVNKYIKQIKNKDVLLNKLRQQIRNVMQSQQKQLQNFRNKEIGDVVHQIQSKTFISFEQLKSQSKKQIEIEVKNNNDLIQQNSKFKGQIAELTKQLMELKQQTKSISHLYNIKSSELEQIRDKHKSEINSCEQKQDELQKMKNNHIQNLQTQLAAKNQQILAQRSQIKMLNTAMININRETFDEALKNQIEASKKLRQELNKKNEEVYRIRDSHAILKAEFDNMKSEGDINRLKFISEKKNIQVQYQVEAQQLKNQLLAQQKKVTALEQKIKLVIDENKKKDNFIQTYIMGKKLPTGERQFITAFLKEYEICVTGKNITQKLQSQSQQLEKLTLYNFNLMKQIAEMKQKMLLYEAISVQNSELSRSMSEFDTPRRQENSRINQDFDGQHK